MNKFIPRKDMFFTVKKIITRDVITQNEKTIKLATNISEAEADSVHLYSATFICLFSNNEDVVCECIHDHNKSELILNKQFRFRVEDFYFHLCDPIILKNISYITKSIYNNEEPEEEIKITNQFTSFIKSILNGDRK